LNKLFGLAPNYTHEKQPIASNFDFVHVVKNKNRDFVYGIRNELLRERIEMAGKSFVKNNLSSEQGLDNEAIKLLFKNLI
jgi:hypothetical protein